MEAGFTVTFSEQLSAHVCQIGHLAQAISQQVAAHTLRDVRQLSVPEFDGCMVKGDDWFTFKMV